MATKQDEKTTSVSDESREARFAGAYFAILPAHPSIAPDRLLETCQSLREVEGLVKWTHHRSAALIHPQLSEPLKYLELSAQLECGGVAGNDAEAIADSVAAALTNSFESVIGNAEVVLVLHDTPIPLMDSSLPMDGSAETFRDYGLVGVPSAVSSHPEAAASLLDELHSHALAEFERLYAALLEAQSSSSNVKKHFREIMTRDDRRFDFRLDLCSNDGDDGESDPIIWKKVEREGRWKPIVQEIFGGDHVSLIKCGCVLSLPSCGMQYWHSDGKHEEGAVTLSFSSSLEEPSNNGGGGGGGVVAPPSAVCVFVPLVDLTETTGYTEFWAGSHKYGSTLLQNKGEQSLPGGTRGILRRGDALIYDYRTIHRGTSNSSTDMARPVCYYLYARQGHEHVEDQNFESQSVFTKD